jgi:aspartyl-tRNA(Asn)/glutamyl-tRNA(Gln) amidotransferase subunit A
MTDHKDVSVALVAQSALALASQIKQQHLSAEALLQACYDQIEAHEGDVGAFLSLNKDSAFEQAQAVDAKAKAGDALPLLAGVPIGIKDNLSVTGTKTTCASKMLANYVAPYDATVVKKLKTNGLPLLGKTNLDEFAMGSSTENSAFQLTKNPWDLERVPGGSSGGSAACVAAGMAPLALGSDTGGSVRLPASFCGLVGLKPTYGLVSRYGLVAYASSLDQVSPFARTVSDVAALLQVIAGVDEADMTSFSAPKVLPDYVASTSVEGFEAQCQGKPLRVGVIQELVDEAATQPEVSEAFNQTLALLEQAGACVVPVSITAIKEAIAAYYIIAPAEASSNLARFDGVRYGHRTTEPVANVQEMYRKTRAEGFGTEVKRRIMLGTFALSSGYYDAYYGKAQATRQLLKQSFDKAFADVDVLICPTCPTTAFKLGEKTADPITMYLTDVATIPVNLVGIPAISVPAGFDKAGLPIGVQLMAPRWQEPRLLAVASHVERLVGLSNLLPTSMSASSL